MRRMITEKERSFFEAYAKDGAVAKYSGITYTSRDIIQEWSGITNITDYMRNTRVEDSNGNIGGISINFNGAIAKANYAFTNMTVNEITISNLTVLEAEAFIGNSTATRVNLYNVKFKGNFNGFIFSSKLAEVLGWADVSEVVAFGSLPAATALKRLQFRHFRANFDISQSTQWTTDSLVEIIDNLDDTGSAHTLNMGATNLAKLSEAQKKVALNKGWNLA